MAEESASAPPTPGAGYRDELGRAVRFNAYLRILFSLVLLAYTVFGPGLLLRFPVTGEMVRFEAVSQFFAFRPVIFALLLVAFVSVLAALAHRAAELFAVKAAIDIDTASPASERESYFRHFQPSPFPFVLSGNAVIDVVIFAIALVAYSLWVLLLVETMPSGMGAHEVVGVVLGSYGLFATLMIVSLVWNRASRRARAVRTQLVPDTPTDTKTEA